MIQYLFIGITALLLGSNPNPEATPIEERTKTYTIKYKKQEVNGVNIFYREAGNPNNPAVVLLHGFPTSSHQYQKVLAALADDYYLIAPDYPGFGGSDVPGTNEYSYTFDNIANSIDGLLEKLQLTSYVLMIQDYGAPVGFRIATKHPEHVKGFVVQNGNAYVEGMGEEAWAGLKQMRANRTPETEKPIADFVFSYEGLKWQYTHGTKNPEHINPDNWNLDYLKINRPGVNKINLDLLYDYRNNLKLYPQWQEYLRENQPPMLIVWGKNDAFFPEAGAQAYKKDVKNLEFYLLDTGHFALEEEAEFIIQKMRTFLQRIQLTTQIKTP